MSQVLLGVYDDDGNPFCVRCWSKLPKLSTNTIMLDSPGAEASCSDCCDKLSETFLSPESPGMLKIVPDIDKAPWTDLHEINKQGKLIWLSQPVMSIGRMTAGMKSGASSVSIRIDLPDGKVVLAETTMKLFLMCADIFRHHESGAA